MAASTLAAHLPRVLLYPLQGHALATVVLVTMLLGIGLHGLIALVPLILGVSFTAHYAIRVIEHTSLGHATPPRLSAEALMLADRYTWSALLLPAVLLTLYLRELPGLLWPLALLLPAHWIALATTRSLLAACNPLRLLQIVLHSALPYAVMCALLAAAVLLAQQLRNTMGSLLLIAAWLYLLFAGCHLLGFVAYLRHERLGVGVQVARPSRAGELEAEQSARLDTLMAALRPLIARRDHAAAAQLIWNAAPGPADARRFHETLYERLKSTSARGLTLTQAARLISFLLDRRQIDRALEVFENALDLDPRFRPESVLQLPALAQRAIESRQHVLLDRLLDAAQAGFAGDPGLRLLDLVRVRLSYEVRRDEPATRALLAAMGPLATHPQGQDLGAYARALSVASPTPEYPPPGQIGARDRDGG